MPQPMSDPAFEHPQSIDLLCLYPPFGIRLYFSQSKQWLSYSDAHCIWSRYHKLKPTDTGAHPTRRSRRKGKPQHDCRSKTSKTVGRVVSKRKHNSQSRPANTA